jgi:putative membrane protein
MGIKISYIRNHLEKKVRETRLLLIIFFSVGVFGTATDASRDLFISLTPLALLLSMLIILAYHQPQQLLKEALVFISVFITGFIIEAAGVNTGRIFGSYSYGEGLGIKLFSTPLLIGINWVLLVYCSAVITERTALPDIIKILISSSIMVVYDLILEQAAPQMNMWSFEGGQVPLRNYFAWFLLAIIFHSLLKLAGIKLINRIAPFVLYTQALFFVILTIFFKLAG